MGAAGRRAGLADSDALGGKPLTTLQVLGWLAVAIGVAGTAAVWDQIMYGLGMTHPDCHGVCKRLLCLCLVLVLTSRFSSGPVD